MPTPGSALKVSQMILTAENAFIGMLVTVYDVNPGTGEVSRMPVYALDNGTDIRLLRQSDRLVEQYQASGEEPVTIDMKQKKGEFQRR